MPFVVCASQGGPYEDAAFVAGYECGLLDAELSRGVRPEGRFVRSSSVRQIDLIAMRHGFVMEAEPWEKHPDEWTRVTFVREGP